MSTTENPFDLPRSPFSGRGKPSNTPPRRPETNETKQEPTDQPFPALPDFNVKASGSVPLPVPHLPDLPTIKPTYNPRVIKKTTENLFPAPTTEDVDEEEYDDEFSEEDTHIPSVEEIYEENFGEPFEETEELTEEELDLLDKRLDATLSPAALPTLYALAEDPDWIVRSYVATNESTPPVLLERLAKDEDAFIRENVLENPNCPEIVYRAFAYDTDDMVVSTWIDSERTTADMLKVLFNTKNPYIASLLIDSHLVPKRVKDELKTKMSL